MEINEIRRESETASSPSPHATYGWFVGVAASHLSEQRGLCTPGTAARLAKLLQQLDLPVTIPADLSTDHVLERMGLDKKNVTGTRRLILLEALGQACIDSDSRDEQIRRAIDHTR